MPKPADPKRLFPPFRREGDNRLVQRVECRACRAHLDLNVNTPTPGGMSDETVMRKAGLKGWRFARQGRDPDCPTCVRSLSQAAMMRNAAADPDKLKALMREDGLSDRQIQVTLDAAKIEAVYSLGAFSLEHLQETIEGTGLGQLLDAAYPLKDLKESPTMATPAPPPVPSRDDKRRILERLTDCYVSEEVGYSADWSDAKIAAELAVPLAWVTALRIEFHGDNGDNEQNNAAARERTRKIHELRKDLGELETRFLAAMAKFDQDHGALSARLAKLEGVKGG